MSREPIRIPFAPRNQHTVSITLEADVLAKTAAFAERIEMANRKNRRKNKQGLTAKGKESLQLRIRGLSGEAALAIYLGVPPLRFADDWRARPDVLCFDCLTTDKPHGSLIITPRDRMDMMKVLVIDESPVFHICGWYRVSDCREEAQRRHSEWWRTEREHGGAWYVPQAFLRSLRDPEALMELTRYARAWSETHEGFVLLKPDNRIELVESDGSFKGLEVNHFVLDEMNDPATIDWREVLRRAGAAPPDEEEFKAYRLGVFPPEQDPQP